MDVVSAGNRDTVSPAPLFYCGHGDLLFLLRLWPGYDTINGRKGALDLAVWGSFARCRPGGRSPGRFFHVKCEHVGGFGHRYLLIAFFRGVWYSGDRKE